MTTSRERIFTTAYSHGWRHDCSTPDTVTFYRDKHRVHVTFSAQDTRRSPMDRQRAQRVLGACSTHDAADGRIAAFTRGMPGRNKAQQVVDRLAQPR